jgi:hypothetical protein
VLEKLQEYSTAQNVKFSPGLWSMILGTLELINPESTCDEPRLTDETKVVTSFIEASIKRIKLPSSDLSVAQKKRVSGGIQLYAYNFSTVETKLLNYLYGVF